MQQTFKSKKPPNLQMFQREIVVDNEIPELDTFEEFCSNIPDQDNQGVNFSKQSQSNDSRQPKSENHRTSESRNSNQYQSNQSRKKQASEEQENKEIQYMEFVEFNSHSITSESNHQKADSQQSNNDGIQEPPAPQNKNMMKFSFPEQSDHSLNSLKKQLCLKQQSVNHNESQSASEYTVLKQQSFDNKISGTINKYVSQLQEENIKNQLEFQQQFLQLQQQNRKLQEQLSEHQEQIKNLIKENFVLSKKVEQFEKKHQAETLVETSNYKDGLSSQLTADEKLAYLIQKLNQKCQDNARLKYEIIMLQNNIEISETTQMLKLNQQNQFQLDTAKALNNHSPQLQSNNRGQSRSKDSRTSLLCQQKYPLNISISNQESKNMTNLSNMISPLSRCAQIIQERQSQQPGQRNTQYQEDTNPKKIHMKSSTSVGELTQIKQDFINYSNIIHRILRKESYSISSPEGRATQKFKQALNEKLSNLQQDNSKSYTNSLFSLGENKLKEQPGYLKPSSPKRECKKSKQLFGFMNPPLSNSRKQSDLLKSEESHRSELGRLSDKYVLYGIVRKAIQSTSDIFQIMKEMKSRKAGISTKLHKAKMQKGIQLIRPLITEVKSSRINQQ